MRLEGRGHRRAPRREVDIPIRRDAVEDDARADDARPVAREGLGQQVVAAVRRHGHDFDSSSSGN